MSEKSITLIRYSLRTIFLITAIVLLITISRKSEDQEKSIVEFKLEMLEKMKQDSLATKKKAELLINETTSFLERSTHVRKNTNYLLGLIVLALITEILVRIRDNRKTSPNP